MEPSDLEMQILSILWDLNSATVREIAARLPDGKPRAYTTVLSMMQVMERKGLVTHFREGNANRYEPVPKREDVVTPFLTGLMNKVFGGKPASMVQSLIDTETLDEGELKAIRKLVNQALKQQDSKS